jgi:hypoxanthine phosphoribosyltransferase
LALVQNQDDPRVGDVVVAGEDVKRRVTELAAQITADYQGRRPLLVGILKGAFVFLADLIREIDLPVEIDFMAVSSYGSSTRTSGVVRIIKDLDRDIAGRDIILVEDILDSGLTLRYLHKTLMARQPASLEVCTILAREGEHDLDELVRYIGFHIPPGWVVGYGLDVAERHRELPDIRHYNSDFSS